MNLMDVLNQQITFGDYWHLKLKYEEENQRLKEEINHWQEECDKRQHTINFLVNSLAKKRISKDEINKAIDSLFPPMS